MVLYQSQVSLILNLLFVIGLMPFAFTVGVLKRNDFGKISGYLLTLSCVAWIGWIISALATLFTVGSSKYKGPLRAAQSTACTSETVMVYVNGVWVPKTRYKTTYTYEVEGKKYTYEGKDYMFNCPPFLNIYYNANNPQEASNTGPVVFQRCLKALLSFSILFPVFWGIHWFLAVFSHY